MKLIVPVPAPNAALGVLSVPGAAAGLPGPAPMLSVPVEPAFAAITTDGAVTTPPSAIVSVPAPELPTFTPELLLQAEPAPATLTVPCEPAPLPILAAKAVSLMTAPPFVIVSVPVPKLPILSPPPGPMFKLEPAAGHRHRPGRAKGQSDRPAATTVHRAAVLNGQRARAQAADHEVTNVRPRGAGVGYGYRPL